MREEDPKELNDSADAQAGTEWFSVVGIGASAGGLQALQAFFSALPADSGMAFVVIQHRASTQENLLPELLERSARIPVAEIREGTRLAPNTVYINPPHCDLAISGGALQLKPQSATVRLPVDHFLRSLATDQGQRGIAVILSGTGMDGTLGVKAISGEGGLVLVQSPDSAEHRDMPEHAIGTGQADFVLPPADMPEALIEFARLALPHPAKRSESEPPPLGTGLNAVFDLLRNRTGHDFSLYKTNTIVRRVARRMAVQGLADQGAYVRFLREHPEEVDRLFSELLIRVSGFFRDPEAFKALETVVVPDLLKDRGMDQPVRVWVPGCSTGEEAYSIAMLLDEAMARLGRRFPVQIFATDIDAQALDFARAARYPASIAADVPTERLQHYFTRHGKYYEINKRIREFLVFAEQSISKDPPFSRQDLVSCRNLLIYMGPELQKRLMPMFHYALKPKGYLFLGSAESIGNADDLLSPVDRKWNIYRRRGNAFARSPSSGLPLFLGHDSHTPAPASNTSAQQKIDVGELTQRLLLRDHTPPAVLVDGHNQIQFYKGRTARFLEPASGTPTLDIMRMVRPQLERALRTLLHRARSQGQLIRGAPTRLEVDGRSEIVRLTVSPVDDPNAPKGALLVLLEDLGPVEQHAEMAALEQPPDAAKRLAALEQELASTSEALQSSIEELETSNEELQSSNEELQSSNEELQSSNEELETSREELHAVNAKLEDKIAELSRVNADIDNLLGCTDIGIVFIDSQLRIERFTPAVTAIIPLMESDLGRPIDHLAHNLDYQRLPQDIREVLQKLVQKEHEIQGRDGRWYLVRIRPYRSADDRIHGAVLAFVDITQERNLAFMAKLRDALAQSPGMVVLLDLDGNIAYANAAFTHRVGCSNEELSTGKADTRPRPIRLDAPAKQAMQRLLGAGKTWRGELDVRRQDGSWCTARAFFAPIRGAGGEMTHAVAYFEEAPENGGES